MMPATLPTSKTQHAFRILLGLFLLYAGISHMTFRRADFVAQVPDWLTMSKDFVVLASGVVEMLLGLSLVALYRQRVWVGLVVAIFFVAIFPGNIHQYTEGISAFGLDTDTKRLVRLFFQPLLVLWALWSTGALKAYASALSAKPYLSTLIYGVAHRCRRSSLPRCLWGARSSKIYTSHVLIFTPSGGSALLPLLHGRPTDHTPLPASS